MKVNFSELFNVSNGMITPKTAIRIGGVTMNPGVSFNAGGGVSFGGVDLSQYIGKVLEVNRTSDNVYEITGYYQ